MSLTIRRSAAKSRSVIISLLAPLARVSRSLVVPSRSSAPVALTVVTATLRACSVSTGIAIFTGPIDPSGQGPGCSRAAR